MVAATCRTDPLGALRLVLVQVGLLEDLLHGFRYFGQNGVAEAQLAHVIVAERVEATGTGQNEAVRVTRSYLNNLINAPTLAIYVRYLADFLPIGQVLLV